MGQEKKEEEKKRNSLLQWCTHISGPGEDDPLDCRKKILEFILNFNLFLKEYIFVVLYDVLNNYYMHITYKRIKCIYWNISSFLKCEKSSS